jgi:hypothetical protein
MAGPIGATTWVEMAVGPTSEDHLAVCIHSLEDTTTCYLYGGSIPTGITWGTWFIPYKNFRSFIDKPTVMLSTTMDFMSCAEFIESYGDSPREPNLVTAWIRSCPWENTR